MTSSFEIYREGEINFSKPLARALLRDGRLSFGARGLFAYLWDLPSGWRTNSEHLSTVSPQGKTAVRTLLRELEKAGAMKSQAIRNEQGRLAGKRWTLISPERWAIEWSLTNKKLDSTERRDFRPSGNPNIGKPNTKVLQEEGSSIKSTTMIEDDIEKLVDAAVWAHRKGGGKLKNESGFRHIVRARIQKSGASPEDKQSLINLRAEEAASIKREEATKKSYQQQIETNQNALNNSGKIDKAIADFNSLIEPRQNLLLREFEKHMETTNSYVFMDFKKKGLQSKAVRKAFADFFGASENMQ